MEQLPLSRDANGRVLLKGQGPVKIRVGYGEEILGTGGQGTVFRGKIFDYGGEELIMEVRSATWVRWAVSAAVMLLKI